jgi:hypothetical protein
MDSILTSPSIKNLIKEAEEKQTILMEELL